MIFYDELVIQVCDSRHSLSLYFLRCPNLIRHHTIATLHELVDTKRKKKHKPNFDSIYIFPIDLAAPYESEKSVITIQIWFHTTEF